MIKFIQKILIAFCVASVLLLVFSAWKNASVRDLTGPVITMDSDTVTMAIDADMSMVLEGVTASDNRDDDVTDSLVVEGLSNFIEKGRRQATIVAFDSDANVTKTTREVVYSNYVSPRFSLEEPLRYNVGYRESPQGTLEVSDCLDGDLTSDMTISFVNDIDADISGAGEFLMNFKVVNSAGDVADLVATVEYYDSSDDNTAPKVELSDYLIYMKKGAEIDPWNYVKGIYQYTTEYSLEEIDADEVRINGERITRDDIQISNPVDRNTPGCYEIVYGMEGEDGYVSHVRLIVIVED